MFFVSLISCTNKINPVNSELLGSWKWYEYGCVNIYPSPIIGYYKVVFNNKEISYIKNDTLLYKTSFNINFSENIRKIVIDFNKLNTQVKTKNFYLFIDGECQLSDSTLIISNPNCSITLSKI